MGTGPSRVPGSVLERGDDLANNRSVSMTKKNYRVVTAGLEFPEGPIAMSDGSIILSWNRSRAAILTRSLWYFIRRLKKFADKFSITVHSGQPTERERLFV